jgi:hypothetical protein
MIPTPRAGVSGTRKRPSLRAWLRSYRRHRARTFHQLDPSTGHRRCL